MEKTMTQASYEIDHVWMLVERGAPEAELLRALGLASKPGAVTGVELTLTHAAERSAPARWIADSGILTFVDGATPHLHLVIKGGAKGEKHDLRPRLPLTIAR